MVMASIYCKACGHEIPLHDGSCTPILEQHEEFCPMDKSGPLRPVMELYIESTRKKLVDQLYGKN
jgi:hypothetical protein